MDEWRIRSKYLFYIMMASISEIQEKYSVANDVEKIQNILKIEKKKSIEYLKKNTGG